MQEQINGHDEEQARPVGEIAGQIGSAAKELYERIDLGRQIQEHPYRTLAIAAGVGYVIGGGLFTPLTGNLVRVGLRLAMLPAVQQALLGAAEAAGGGDSPEEILGV